MRRLVVVFTTLAVIFTIGCPKPAAPEGGGVVLKVDGAAMPMTPDSAKLLRAVPGLKPAHVKELAKHVAKLLNEQEREAKVRHWLIVAASLLLVGSLASLAGKLLGGVGAWWAVALAWIGAQVRWRSVIVGLLAGGGCAAAAVWLDPIWSYLQDAGWVVLILLGLFADWELAARYYTGKWDRLADGVKPARKV